MRLHHDGVLRTDVIERLSSNDMEYREIRLTENWTIIVSRYGGRIFGPFNGQDGESLLWINPAFRSQREFGALLDSKGPLGGERVWISPEFQFGCRDRDRFWDTLFVLPAVDPGTYQFKGGSSGVVELAQSMDLDAFNPTRGRKTLHLRRSIKPAKNPLQDYQQLRTPPDDVLYAGYTHRVVLQEEEHDAIPSESWCLVQIRPTGQVIIPTTSRARVASYYEDPPPEYIEIGDSRFSCRIDGHRQYKLGIHGASVLGRIGYVSPINDELELLIVRNFFSSPSTSYVDEPPGQPGNNGFSCHVYNDDGRFGGFGELENMGTTIGGIERFSSSDDTVDTWFFVGPHESVRRIAEMLM